MKRILSFSSISRATVHNNTNVLTFAILEHESPFLEEFEQAYNASNAFLARNKTLYQ